MTNYPSKNSLLDIADPDAPVYRIFPFERFLQLIDDRRITFVRPHLWDDPFEHFLLNCELADAEGRPIGLQLLRDSWYGQCWSLKEETDAMWRIYSPHMMGVKIQSSVRKILDPLVGSVPAPFPDLSAFAGRVIYASESEIRDAFAPHSITSILMGGHIGLARSLLIKRDAFSHEQELRFLFQDVEKQNMSSDLYSFPIDPDAMVEGVVLDPRLDLRTFQCLKHGIESAGCNAPVVQSQLYTVESLRMRLH